VTSNPKLKKLLIVVGALVGAQAVFLTLASNEVGPGENTVIPEPSNRTAQPRTVQPPPPMTPTAPPGEARKGLTADMVAALPETGDSAALAYNATGKRDPFRPFDFAPKPIEDDARAPLERYELGQLKLTAVLDGFDEPTAIVENAAGRGFTVKRGAKIGPNGGVIIEILKDRLVIEETVTDFTGASKTTRTELTIRTQDQENEGDIR
jgi:type IV pilus assembly protein PilP